MVWPGLPIKGLCVCNQRAYGNYIADAVGRLLILFIELLTSGQFFHGAPRQGGEGIFFYKLWIHIDTWQKLHLKLNWFSFIFALIWRLYNNLNFFRCHLNLCFIMAHDWQMLFSCTEFNISDNSQFTKHGFLYNKYIFCQSNPVKTVFTRHFLHREDKKNSSRLFTSGFECLILKVILFNLLKK